MDSDPKTTSKFDAALALIARLAERDKLEAIRQNAVKRGATVVAEAAASRLEALYRKPSIQHSVNKDAGYRKQHQVGDYVIEYVDVRGRSWTVNLYREGTFETIAPVVWRDDRIEADGVLTQRINFTTRERAEIFAAKPTFLAASRLRNEDAVGKDTPFDAVLEVKPTGQFELTQSDGRSYFKLMTRVMRILTD